MKLPSFRLNYFFGFLLIVFLLGFSYYLQQYDGETPCPLCILQRFDLIILCIIFLLGFVLPLKKIGQVIFSFLALFISSIGLLLSGRQVWLQHLPSSENADCGVSLNYLLQALPPQEVIKKVFSGTAECSKTGWQFLNLSLAEWSSIFFIVFIVYSVVELVRSIKR